MQANEAHPSHCEAVIQSDQATGAPAKGRYKLVLGKPVLASLGESRPIARGPSALYPRATGICDQDHLGNVLKGESGALHVPGCEVKLYLSSSGRPG